MEEVENKVAENNEQETTQEKEDLTSGQEAEVKEDASLENFFNDNMSNVVKKIREAYPDVYNAIKTEV